MEFPFKHPFPGHRSTQPRRSGRGCSAGCRRSAPGCANGVPVSGRGVTPSQTPGSSVTRGQRLRGSRANLRSNGHEASPLVPRPSPPPPGSPGLGAAAARPAPPPPGAPRSRPAPRAGGFRAVPAALPALPAAGAQGGRDAAAGRGVGHSGQPRGRSQRAPRPSPAPPRPRPGGGSALSCPAAAGPGPGSGSGPGPESGSGSGSAPARERPWFRPAQPLGHHFVPHLPHSSQPPGAGPGRVQAGWRREGPFLRSLSHGEQLLVLHHEARAARVWKAVSSKAGHSQALPHPAPCLPAAGCPVPRSHPQ